MVVFCNKDKKYLCKICFYKSENHYKIIKHLLDYTCVKPLVKNDLGKTRYKCKECSLILWNEDLFHHAKTHYWMNQMHHENR